MRISLRPKENPRAPTRYQIYSLENGCIKILYYRAWVPYKLLGISFWGWDNVFLPTEDGTSTIQQYNTDLDAFQKAWPYAEDYFAYLQKRKQVL